MRLRRAWPAVAAALLAGLILTSSAGAGIVTASQRPAVDAAHLSAAERRAVTLRSISAVADGSLGLIVTATFQGDTARYLGQGDLASGLVALVLVPNAAGTTPGGVLDEGGGFTPNRLPIARRAGNRVSINTQTIDLFSAEQVVRVHTPSEAGVLRDGSQLTFYLGPAALGRLARIKLEVFARSPVPGGREAGTRSWPAILKARPAEVATLSVDQSELSYAQLAGPRNALAGLLSGGVAPELRGQEQAAKELRTTFADYPTVANAVSRMRRLPRTSESALAGDLKRASQQTDRLRSEAAALNTLIAQIDGLIKARTPPPPPPPPPTTTTTTTTTQPMPPPAPNVQVVQTDANLSQNMAAQPGLTTSSTPPQGVADTIDVNDQLRYQQFEGLGAAMTDSSAYVINGMPATDRAALMQDLFGESGSATGLAAPPIHLNFLRIGVAATGAMTVTPAYSYDDTTNNTPDPTLAGFSTRHDEAYIVPTLQQALQTNPSLQIQASPWSPPAWMKNNGSLNNQNNGGTLKADPYPTYYANYLVKFIEAYEQQYGIPIDAITPANEPRTATQYPGLQLIEPEEASFIADDLQPALTTAGLHTKIYGNDLSWDQYAGYASPLAADPSAGPDLAGIAWHCYFGSPTVMSQLHQTNPGLDQIVNECSPEIRSFGTPEFLISTLRNWASVVAAWSVALEPNGGPIQTPNSCGGCRGLVSVDPSTGAVTYRTEYYQFGQISAFVQPGAWRIDSPSFVTYGTNTSNIETISAGLDDVAFLNPDGSKVLVAYNNATTPISFGVQSDGSYFSYTIPAGALTTFVWH